MQPTFLTSSLLALVLASAAAPIAAKPKEPPPSTKAPVHAMISAKAAFEARSIPRLLQAEQALVKDPLRIWPAYWRSQLVVTGQPFAEAAQQAVKAFSEAHQGHVLVRALQRDWGVAALQSAPWSKASEIIRQIPADLDSASLRCTQARLRTDLEPVDLLAVVQGQESTLGCQSLLEDLAARGLIESDGVRDRARAMATQGDLKAAEQLWSAARGLRLSSSEQAVLRLLAMAQIRSTQAAAQLEKTQTTFSAEQRAFLQFAIGSRLWLRSDPKAWPLIREGFGSVGSQPPVLLESAARLSLRMGDWAALRQILAVMPASLQQQDHWAYWRGWLAAQTGQHEQARAIWATIPPGWGFYQILTAEALGRQIFVPPPDARTRRQIAEQRARLADHPSVYRGLKLSALGMRSEASLEWNGLIRDLPDAALLAASQLAFEAGHPDRGIAAAIRTQQLHDLSLRYPIFHRREIDLANRAEPLETAWVLGLMRQESRFLPTVRSPVGAVGLMQLMPKTAKSVARDMGLQGFRLDRLEEPQTNISLGIHYLRDLTRDFKGSAILATAAYNAGPSRSRLWSGQLTQTIPGAAFAESIPFSETRGYVKQVLANTAVYQGLLRQSETSNLLNEWLAQIGPSPSRLAVNP
jgi:soluble lytic murein transglycosylase